MTKPLVEAVIDGFENDVDIDFNWVLRLKEIPEILSAPALEFVTYNCGSDFTARSDTKSQLPKLVALIIDQEPLGCPKSLALVFERDEFRISLNC